MTVRQRCPVCTLGYVMDGACNRCHARTSAPARPLRKAASGYRRLTAPELRDAARRWPRLSRPERLALARTLGCSVQSLYRLHRKGWTRGTPGPAKGTPSPRSRYVAERAGRLGHLRHLLRTGKTVEAHRYALLHGFPWDA